MAEFHLQIVTPDGLVFDGNATGITVNTDQGEVGILARHADFFAPVSTGRAFIRTDDDALRNYSGLASVSGGFISVKDGEVKLVATTFEFREDIDIERARKAKENAENKLRNATDDKTVRILNAKLARALNRINIWQKD